ncbi:hypothetical protein U1872_04785 [Sphingomonas sp. RB3P16]|uniref:hypothetical protein n=1 Tax=Parasphingomonas frigoris TaxID=3096163 RepID=UPI002FC919C0
MQQRSWRGYDLRVRLVGGALVALAVVCVALLPGHRGNPAVPPGTVELWLALIAVAAGSVGASLVAVGRQMFEPVADPRSVRAARGDTGRDA